MKNIKILSSTFSQPGELSWIGLRSQRREPLLSVTVAHVDTTSGLLGDHYLGSNGKRHITLMQKEHLPVISALCRKPVTPNILRRNLLISGINLLALKKNYFTIGEALFFATGLCHPCSRMEEILGPGGYNVMRGHGGLTAQVISGGTLRVGDQVIVLQEDSLAKNIKLAEQQSGQLSLLEDDVNPHKD